MVQLDYWIPTRNMTFIVNKLYQLLNKHANIWVDTEMNDPKMYAGGSFLPIEKHLLDLASFVDVGNKDDIDDEEYIRIFNKADIKISKKKSATIWKSGTGYGHGGSSEWDINTYLKSLAERDKHAKTLLNKIIVAIQDCKDPKVIYNALQYSILMKYIKSLLSDTTLLEIRKHIDLYKMVFVLLSNLANEDAIYLFDKASDSKPEEKTLYDYLFDLNLMCFKAQKFAKNSTNITATSGATKDPSELNDDELTNIIINVFSMIRPCYENYIVETKKKSEDKTPDTKIKEKENTDSEIYVKTMSDLRDSDADFKIVNTNYHYKDVLNKNKNVKLPSSVVKRINDEILIFRSLPINYDAIIISRPDANYQTAIRTLMTGPVNTPYEGGCFLFDTYLHSNFPNSSPFVWFLNTGGKRMNPNLYNCGKVCLSILGTWGGDRGAETWNSAISTLSLIYKSIQSLILIEQPFFNEPGYESHYSSAAGMAQSKTYNDNIRLYTMEHAMLDLIDNPKLYPQFEDVIRAHFKMKKTKILSICEKWIAEAPAALKSHYNKIYTNIKSSIEKL